MLTKIIGFLLELLFVGGISLLALYGLYLIAKAGGLIP